MIHKAFKQSDISKVRYSLLSDGRRLGRGSMVFLLAFSLITQPLLAQTVTTVTSDASAGDNRPDILRTGNGVVQVNIVGPNAEGLSHNKYTQFDIGNDGLILNNSLETVSQSQLGGLVIGNDKLRYTGNARVILNEVNSSNRSMLEGTLEVHGKQAGVVIANPNGLTCNGCKFINTSRTTLTTGTPVIGASGALDGLKVTGGSIEVGSFGADLQTVDVFDLVTRKLTVTGPVQVLGTLNAVVGANDYAYSTGLVTPLPSDGKEPGVAIDSTLVGGMRAGQIRIISTDKGAGVNVSGQLASHTGQMRLTANGRLVLGQVKTKGKVQIRSESSDVVLGDAVEGLADVDISAAKDIALLAGVQVTSLEGMALNGDSLTLGVGSFLGSGFDDQGRQSAQSSLTVRAGRVDAGQGQIASGYDLSITSDQLLFNRGSASFADSLSATRDINLTTAMIDGTNGLLRAGGALSVRSDQALRLNGGTYQSGGMSSLSSLGDLTLDVTLKSMGAVSLTSETGSLTNKGLLESNSDITAEAGTTLVNHGDISALKRLSLSAGEGISNLSEGELVANAGLSLTAASLNNAGEIVAQGGDLGVTLTDKLDNEGLLSSLGKMSISLDGDLGNSGDILSKAALVVAGKAGETAGNLVNDASGEISGASLDMTVASLGNKGLLATTTDELGIHLLSDGDLTNSGDIISRASLTIDSKAGAYAGNLVNEASGEISGAELDVAVSGLENEGLLATTAGKLAIDSSGNLNNNHLIQSAGDLALTTDETINLTGNVLSKGKLEIGSLAGSAESNLSVAEGVTVNGEGGVTIRGQALENEGSIGSSSGDLVASLSGDLNNKGLLYSGGNGTYKVDGTLSNVQADILAEGSLTFSGLSKAASTLVHNVSGTIEAITGSISLLADTFVNERESLAFKRIEVDRKVSTSGKTTTTVVTTQDQLTSLDPASRFLAGGDISIKADQVTNSYSQIAASGDVTIEAGNLDNQGRDLIEYIDTTHATWHSKTVCDIWIPLIGCVSDHKEYWTTYRYEDESATYDALFASIEAGGNLTATATGYLSNEALRSGAGQVGLSSGDRALEDVNGLDDVALTEASEARQLKSLTAIDVSVASILDRKALFNVIADPDAPFLVETRGDFIDPGKYYGSDYFLDSIGYSPDQTMKRFGDAYVETLVVSNQVFEMTGSRYLGGFTDERAMMEALYDGAIEASEALDLVVGVALTPDQIEALTTDIIWLETKVINGEEVLTPRLYLSRATSDTVDLNSGRIKAREVELAATSLENSGLLEGAEGVSVTTTEDLVNRGGTISSDGDVTLEAGDELRNQSGVIEGDKVKLLGDSVSLETEKLRDRNRNGYGDRVQQLSRVEAEGDLTIEARGDLVSTGSQLSSGGDTTLSTTEGDVRLEALELETKRRDNFSLGYDSSYDQKALVNTLSSDGDINIKSGGDVTSEGTRAQADGSITIEAKGDVAIGAAREVSTSDSKISTTTSGFFSSTTTTERASSSSNTAVGSQFVAGEDVTITGGGNVDFAGSVVADKDITLEAKEGDLTLQASGESFNQSSQVVETKSGLFSNGGLSVTLGTQRSEVESSSDADLHQKTSLYSGGDIDLKAAETLTVEGVDVAGGGSVNLEAEDVDIRAVEDRIQQETRTSVETSGLSVGLTGGLVDKLDSLDSLAEKFANTDSDKLKAAIAAKGAYEVKDLADIARSMKKDGLDGSGVSLSVSLGTSSTETETTTVQTTNQGSTVTGERVDVTARDGDIHVAGSTLEGTESLGLDASDDVIIESVQDRTNTDTQISSESASIGAEISLSGDVTVKADLSASDTDIAADTVTQVDSKVRSDGTVTITSGDDTTLAGAQVEGETVRVNVGDDLTIESRQDEDNYSEETDSISASVSVSGTGGSGSVSVSDSSIDSTWASVDEQTGIHAGEGGFDVTVGDRTTLDGGAIVSEGGAEQSKLTTEELVYSDVENKAEYASESTTVGAGFSSDKGLSPSVSPGFGAEGEASSETKATVSEGATIETSGGEAHDVAGLNRDEAQAHETLNKIFDLQEIKDEQEYVKIAGEVMGRAMEPVIQKIGEAYHGGEISGAEQKMAHAIIGCITGGVVNGDCASGAVGAVAAEVAAEAYLKSAVLDAYEKGELTEERYNEIRKQAILTGQIAGGIAGASIGGDVGIASEAGKRAAENNAAKKPMTGGLQLCPGGDVMTPGCGAPFGMGGGGSKIGNRTISDFFSGGARPKASKLKSWAEGQGWKPTQTTNGPLKYVDQNGTTRLTIKQGSKRAQGSDKPHVEVRDSSGQRIDPATGQPTTRKDPVGNHRIIDYDL